jgi:hypothetical protein
MKGRKGGDPMSDRKSCRIFAGILELLARDCSDDRKALAREVVRMSREYDFSLGDTGADDAGIALGVARRGIDPRYPGDGEMTLWLGEDYEE